MSETGEVTAFWQRLGVPGMIDVHTHFMPQNVLVKVWAYFDSFGPDVEWPIRYRTDETDRLARLRAFGVRAFTSLVYPHKPDMAAWLNTWAADFADRTPDCLRTATFFPEPAAAEYVRQAIDGGTRVFKAHLQVGGYDPNDQLLEPVWGMIEDAAVPVVVHCGSGPVPGRFTGPGPTRALLDRHPNLRLIVAHMGMPEHSEFLDITGDFDHVHLDTTMAFTDFTEAMAPFARTEHPRLRDLGDRIVLGTDFPNIPYGYRHQLHALERLELGDDWLRGVVWENPRRLFGLAAK